MSKESQPEDSMEREHNEYATVDFVVKGEPRDKVAPDALCSICEKTFAEHTMEMHRECLAKTREAKA